MNNIVYTLSQDMSISDIESLYYNLTLKQEFYNDAYGHDWRIKPYKCMADLICRILKPNKHVDIGCGKGLLVQTMRARDVQSYGIDFSDALIDSAHPKIKKYLKAASTESELQEVLLQDFDIISYMEVFEHLPAPLLSQILQLLFSKFNGKLFLTIPSHGIDHIFFKGLPIGHKEWQRDMTVNIPFKNIVLENGKPHCGHITLASYRWWTEFFLFHGFIRNIDLERECLTLFNSIITKYKWNPYILQKIKLGSQHMTVIEPDFLGTGWHYYEAESNARWTDGHAVMYFQWDKPTPPAKIKIVCLAPAVEISMESNLVATIDGLYMDNDYRLQWIPMAESRPVELINRGQWCDVVIPLENFKSFPGEKIYTIRAKFITPYFNPKKYGLSADDRDLGVKISSVDILT